MNSMLIMINLDGFLAGYMFLSAIQMQRRDDMPLSTSFSCLQFVVHHHPSISQLTFHPTFEDFIDFLCTCARIIFNKFPVKKFSKIKFSENNWINPVLIKKFRTKLTVSDDFSKLK